MNKQKVMVALILVAGIATMVWYGFYAIKTMYSNARVVEQCNAHWIKEIKKNVLCSNFIINQEDFDTKYRYNLSLMPALKVEP